MLSVIGGDTMKIMLIQEEKNQYIQKISIVNDE